MGWEECDYIGRIWVAEDSSKSCRAGPVAVLGLEEGANEIIGENIPASTSKSLRDEERLEVLLGGWRRWLGVPDRSS